MVSVSIDIPQGFVGLSEEGLQNDIKCCLAAMYYQRSVLSIGKAAELAGLHRVEFELFLSRNKIPVSMLNIADIRKEAETLKRLGF